MEPVATNIDSPPTDETKRKKRASRLWTVWTGIRGKFAVAKMARHVYVFDPRGTCRRQWSVVENFKRAIKHECSRCGWHTNKIRIRAFLIGDRPKDGEKDSRKLHLFTNIGPFRGLDPQQVMESLLALRSYCGHENVLRVLGKLEERVEHGDPIDTAIASAVSRLQGEVAA